MTLICFVELKCDVVHRKLKSALLNVWQLRIIFKKIKFLIDNNSSNQGVYSGNNITNIQNINQYSNVITNNFSDNNGTYNALSFNNINGTNKDNSDDKVLEIYYYNNKGKFIKKNKSN